MKVRALLAVAWTTLSVGVHSDAPSRPAIAFPSEYRVRVHVTSAIVGPAGPAFVGALSVCPPPMFVPSFHL